MKNFALLFLALVLSLAVFSCATTPAGEQPMPSDPMIEETAPAEPMTEEPTAADPMTDPMMEEETTTAP